jgi:hypothetical protein
MARRTFDVPNVTEILVHWDAGRSQSEIATSLGLDRKTVKKYLTPAIEAGLEPGGGRTQAEWSVLVRDWFPRLADTTLRQYRWPLIEQHRDYIVEQLEAGVTKATIHQRLRDEHDLQASVASLKRWIAANLPEQALRSKVTVLGEDPAPGSEGQIDYGYLGTWLDPIGGRRRRVGVRDGVVLQPAPVSASGAANGSAGLDATSRRSASSVLNRHPCPG